jgi:hypothetical protein
VSAIQESVTVSGQTPVVDFQNVQTTQVVNRDVMDSVPTGRSFRSIGMLITGVHAQSQSVGDSNAMTPQIESVHGLTPSDSVVLLDGLLANTLMGDGQIQQYHNDAVVQEVSYQTSANSADVSYGGFRTNLIPRDGANTFHGGGFFSDMEGGWQSNNLTPALQARGLIAQNKTIYTRDNNPWLGGPVRQDNIWFFLSYRYFPNPSSVGNVFY